VRDDPLGVSTTPQERATTLDMFTPKEQHTTDVCWQLLRLGEKGRGIIKTWHHWAEDSLWFCSVLEFGWVCDIVHIELLIPVVAGVQVTCGQAAKGRQTRRLSSRL